MNNKIFILLSFIASFLLTACQLQEDGGPPKIVGEALLQKTSRSSSLDFERVPTIKLFDASSIELDLSELEQIYLESQSIAIRNQKQVYQQLEALIKNQESNALDLELMLSDEALEEGKLLVAIESPSNQSCSMELYNERGGLFVADRKLQLKEGTNYKIILTEELSSTQYLLLLKADNGKVFMQKINFEQ